MDRSPDPPTMTEPAPPSDGYQASATALSTLTTMAENHEDDPLNHLHTSADHPDSHRFLSRLIPVSTLTSLENRFHMGNYVLDRQTGEKTWEAMSIYVRVGMHLLYYGTEEEKALRWNRTLTLLQSESEKMGRQYDSPASVAHIPPFIKAFNLAPTLPELLEPNPSKYPTFNAFFAREIHPSARPIASPTNDLISSSPADCRLTAFPTIDLATQYWIKGSGFTLAKLLDSADLARHFDRGSILIARLAPQDYHRWHAPVSGAVESVTLIPGAYYTVNPQAINEPGTLDVFCENKRSVMMVRRRGTGAPIAIVAVGAMLVGSISYVRGSDRVGGEIVRGQCLGAFYYGGSTVIVLYPRGEIVLDEDLVRNSTEAGCETLVRVGWRVGVTE